MPGAMENAFLNVYTKLNLHFYQRIFQRLNTREATLSTVEALSVEIINALGTPTVTDFARFINISVANATYKVQCLIKKGYLTKEQSKDDRRVYHLHVTDRFSEYQKMSTGYISQIFERVERYYPPDEVAKLTEMLEIISTELMPEIENIHA